MRHVFTLCLLLVCAVAQASIPKGELPKQSLSEPIPKEKVGSIKHEELPEVELFAHGRYRMMDDTAGQWVLMMDPKTGLMRIIFDQELNMLYVVQLKQYIDSPAAGYVVDEEFTHTIFVFYFEECEPEEIVSKTCDWGKLRNEFAFMFGTSEPIRSFYIEHFP